MIHGIEEYATGTLEGPPLVPSSGGDRREMAMAGQPPAGRWSGGIDWPTFLWMAAIHLGALAAPLWFTWKSALMSVVLIWVCGCLGVCLGYHRLLTHGSFKTFRPVRWFFAWLGSMAGEGPPITWVVNHRKHHQYSDQEGDPHSPKDGGLWSHMLWFFPRVPQAEWSRLKARYAPDLLKDPVMRFINGGFLFWHLATGAAFLAVGWTVWDLRTGISLLLFGMFVRLVCVYHITWLVNSATHIWGYRNYVTTDNSRNLWWVGLLAFGEGWHNNHHAYQRSARHGHRWWEFDMTYLVIRGMERLGLAWDVVRNYPGQPAKGL
jgi:stearoyl-CoA desaturase (delta-9 desaturase)